MEQFTLEVMQAINDWQRGGDHNQKVRRGERLKEVSLLLEKKYRVCNQLCYRQEAHDEPRLWSLLADNCLPETIAAWTIDEQLAKNFKGGVAPEHLLALIFSHNPKDIEVIINLNTVYASEEFLCAIEKYRQQIIGYYSGIDKYKDTQKEVVLELNNLDTSDILYLGGYSGTLEDLAILNGSKTPDETLKFQQRIKELEVEPKMPWWLSSNGTQNVLERVKPKVLDLKERK